MLYEGKGVIAFSLSDVKDVVYEEAGCIRVLFNPSTDFNNGKSCVCAYILLRADEWESGSLAGG